MNVRLQIPSAILTLAILTAATVFSVPTSGHGELLL